MKHLSRLSGLAAGLLLGGLASVAAAQDQTESHDFQFDANMGSPRVTVQGRAGVLSYPPAGPVLASSGITIPAGQMGFLLTTFSGESRCTGTPGAWCWLVVSVNGIESHPIVGDNFAFDSVASDQWESHSIQRISELLPTDTYIVQVFWGVVGDATFWIDDWLLTIKYLRAS